MVFRKGLTMAGKINNDLQQLEWESNNSSTLNEVNGIQHVPVHFF